MATTDDSELPVTYHSLRGDTHELTRKSRDYGEAVITGSDWPLDDVDLTKVLWKTSTHAKRRHGYCSYEDNGHVTITISEHTYENAGFDACKDTIRHELVHAWQHQHLGETVTVAGTSITVDEKGHKDSFRVWVPLLDLQGRCSNHYTKERDDYNYIMECPSCDEWFGNHRLCKRVRQSASGGTTRIGCRYCKSCEVKLYLYADGLYLQHGNYTDDQIRAFVDGESSIQRTHGIHPDKAAVKSI